MTYDITGKKVAFLLTDGYEDSELTSPWEAVTAAGGVATLVSPTDGSVSGKNGHSQSVDAAASGADASDYDALVLPGGQMNPDILRTDKDVVAFVKEFAGSGKVVAAICHGPWLLVEADVVRGKRVTSWPSVQTDLKNAGAHWEDSEVVTDHGLITSRKPDDIPAFNKKIVEEMLEPQHGGNS